MKSSWNQNAPMILTFFLGIIVGIVYMKYFGAKKKEGFSNAPICGTCGGSYPCKGGCGPSSQVVCAPCPTIDYSKFVLKSTIPPCQQCPDMSAYILKSEVPPIPDLSKYVLKSSIQKPQPIIIDSSACKKDVGECPPCPRPRCKIQQCPTCPACPVPAPCPRPVCLPQQIKCKSEEAPSTTVRPFLSPLSMSGFGS